MNDVAAELAGTVDYERLQLEDGGIDLQVLGTYQAPLRKAAAALAASDDALKDASSPWVAGPIQDRISELDRRVGRARVDAETARLSVDTAPALLGADGPRRYLMLLGNPAEARDIGGHLGNWAEVVAEGGRLPRDPGRPPVRALRADHLAGTDPHGCRHLPAVRSSR